MTHKKVTHTNDLTPKFGQKTLGFISESIKLLLFNGHINDAFALVRKYYEEIIIYIYKSVYIIEKHDIFKSLYVEQIEKWFKGEDKLSEYKNMIKYLNRVQILDGIRQFYNIQSDGYYNKIKEFCNANLQRM